MHKHTISFPDPKFEERSQRTGKPKEVLSHHGGTRGHGKLRVRGQNTLVVLNWKLAMCERKKLVYKEPKHGQFVQFLIFARIIFSPLIDFSFTMKTLGDVSL